MLKMAGEEICFVLKEGDVLEIEPGLKHQFTGVAERTEIIKISTQHFNSGSIRTEKGDQVEKRWHY